MRALGRREEAAPAHGAGGPPGQGAGDGPPGLHLERTLLAWIRTAAALAAGGLVVAGAGGRYSGDGVAAIPFVLASLCGGVLLARVRVRHRRVRRGLRRGLPIDGRVDALLAWIGVLAAASGAIAFVLTSC